MVINGVKWATRNVDMPGKFAQAPESTGMFYQWNRHIGWSGKDSLKAYGDYLEFPDAIWDATSEWREEWLSENDPCPEGWRVPGLDDLAGLSDHRKVTSEWVRVRVRVNATESVVAGRRFTDKKTGKSIFLPASGYLVGSTGEREFAIEGNYWSALPDGGYPEQRGYVLKFSRNYINPALGLMKNHGFSVRCVAE